MESPRHHRLKVLSLAFLRSAGCAAAGTEVRSPASRYRADAAGYADPLPKTLRPGPVPGMPKPFGLRVSDRATTVIIECKQCREDFLRDTAALDSLLRERADLDARRRHLEERLIRASEPHLRASDQMLFADMEAWDFSASRSPGYRAVVRDLRRIEERIHGDTKFWTMARYRLADLLLIAAPAGLLRAAECPPGWGLVEFPKAWLDATAMRAASDGGAAGGLYTQELEVRLRCPPGGALRPSRDEHRVRLLRNIAVAATARTLACLPETRVRVVDLPARGSPAPCAPAATA